VFIHHGSLYFAQPSLFVSNLCAAVAARFEEASCTEVVTLPFDDGSTNLPECPTQSSASICTMEYLPVQCGDNNCEYSNLCIAEAAGFAENDCELVNSGCPEMAAGLACTMEYLPVQCGDNNCEYSNLCSAQAAGFAEDDCETVSVVSEVLPEQLLDSQAVNITECPTESNATICTTEYLPVQCGDNNCEYSNLCIAEAAGFAEDDCELVNFECPEMAAGVACTLEYLPVQCGGNNCEYSNLCSAQAAGFAEDDCEAVNDLTEALPEQLQESQAVNLTECPTQSSASICTMEYLPVRCGDNNCEYSNLCIAEAAGFAENNCKLVNSGCPEMAAGVACTLEYLPVQCGDNNCEYSNLCSAQAAGFSEDDCGAVNDLPQALPEQLQDSQAVNLTECPVSESVAACTLDFNPVVCGDCEYSNLCNAEAAGFAEDDCELVNFECPEMVDVVACTMEYLPVQCGDYNCEYSNLCNAQAAGFAQYNCEVVTDLTEALPEQLQDSQAVNLTECPVSESVTACTLEFNPVVCGGCEYSNLCNAEAAGFAEDDCELVNSECPEMAAGVACTMEYLPVQCGENNCEYSNLCSGTAAGFEEGDCSPVEGETPEAVATTTESDAEESGVEQSEVVSSAISFSVIGRTVALMLTATMV